MKFKLIQLKSQNNFFDFLPTRLYYLDLSRAFENFSDPPQNKAGRPANAQYGVVIKFRFFQRAGLKGNMTHD
ncbi:MAG: hypothetical protein P8X85_01375 [Desulfobacterales bacterium]